jgi:hypothetical protein
MNENKLRYIIDKIIRRFSGVTYNIKSSKTTPSCYIRFYYEDCQKTVRVSDHRKPQNTVMTTNTSLKAGDDKMERFFINNIKSLQRQHMYKMYDKISQEDLTK